MIYAKIEKGTVNIYNLLPLAFENILNFRKATLSAKQEKGFFEVVRTALTKYQKYIVLEDSDFDSVSKVFNQRIENLSQEDSNRIDEDETDSNILLIDGQEMNLLIWKKIKVQLIKENITKTQYRNIVNSLYDAVLPLHFGHFFTAKIRVDALPIPSNAKLLNILNKVKALINNYITENNI